MRSQGEVPELLRGVQDGNRYTISLRGVALADLVPPQGNRLSAVGAVDEMLSFMRTRKLALNANIDLKVALQCGRA